MVDFLDLMFTNIFKLGDLTNYKQIYSQWQVCIEIPFLTYQYNMGFRIECFLSLMKIIGSFIIIQKKPPSDSAKQAIT